MYADRDKNLMVVLYVISMAVAHTSRYGNYRVGYKVQIVIGLVWLVIAFAKLAANGLRFKSDLSKDCAFFLKLYLLPHVLIHLYSILLIAIGKVDSQYLGTNLTVYVPTMLAVLAFYLFGKKALRYTCVAIAISWCISVVTSVMAAGFGIFAHSLYQGWIDSSAQTQKNYLELHDMVLGIGYLLCYYVVSREKWTAWNLFAFFMAALIMFLGVKRVSLVGIVLVVLFHGALRLCKEHARYKICMACGAAGVVLCYLFILVLSSGDLFYLVFEKLGINLMGRNYFYKAVIQLSEFRVDFLGIGRNVVAERLKTDLAYLRVGGVHSDIIKMYVENGFVMFGFWLWYYLLHIPRAYKNRFGYKPAVLYFTLIIYTFILYLTDNTENYFTCQILMISLPMYFALISKETDQASAPKPRAGLIRRDHGGSLRL